LTGPAPILFTGVRLSMQSAVIIPINRASHRI
jgi:hypothetical protein